MLADSNQPWEEDNVRILLGGMTLNTNEMLKWEPTCIMQQCSNYLCLSNTWTLSPSLDQPLLWVIQLLYANHFFALSQFHIFHICIAFDWYTLVSDFLSFPGFSWQTGTILLSITFLNPANSMIWPRTGYLCVRSTSCWLRQWMGYLKILYRVSNKNRKKGICLTISKTSN